MDKYVTKTFIKFFFGFVTIIGIAFAVIIVTASNEYQPVDNVAIPR